MFRKGSVGLLVLQAIIQTPGLKFFSPDAPRIYHVYIYILYMNIDYLPTLSAKWPHGKDSLRGAFGLYDMILKRFWGCFIGMPQ